jgi:hypothetical protein
MKKIHIPYKLWDKARDHWYEEHMEPFLHMREFLGEGYQNSYKYDPETNSIIAPEATLPKIEALASPHYKTLIKVWKARRK